MFKYDLEDGREDIDKIDEPAAALISDWCDSDNLGVSAALHIKQSNDPTIIKLFICDLCIITLYKMP